MRQQRWVRGQGTEAGAHCDEFARLHKVLQARWRRILVLTAARHGRELSFTSTVILRLVPLRCSLLHATVRLLVVKGVGRKRGPRRGQSSPKNMTRAAVDGGGSLKHERVRRKHCDQLLRFGCCCAARVADVDEGERPHQFLRAVMQRALIKNRHACRISTVQCRTIRIFTLCSRWLRQRDGAQS